jgi:hypothetical protein
MRDRVDGIETNGFAVFLGGLFRLSNSCSTMPRLLCAGGMSGSSRITARNSAAASSRLPSCASNDPRL